MFSQTRKTLLFRKFPIIKVNSDITLRKPDVKDAADWYCYMTRPNVAKYVPDPCIPVSISHAEKEIQWYINLFDSKSGISWFIVDNKNDKMIGTISLEKWSSYHKRTEIAYDLNPDYWGKGIMSASIKECIKVAFKQLGVVRIEAYTTTCNTQSINLLKKLNFQHEGILRKQRSFKNKQIDVNIFALLKDEFK